MMDCEGCEWGALQNLACDSDSLRVNQIIVEFDFQINLGLQHPSDVLLAADALRCLWQRHWNISSIEGSGAGKSNWNYTDGMYNVLHTSGMLAYVAMQQIPEDELSPAEMLEVTTLHGRDNDKWPDEVKAAVHKNRPGVVDYPPSRLTSLLGIRKTTNKLSWRGGIASWRTFS